MTVAEVRREFAACEVSAQEPATAAQAIEMFIDMLRQLPPDVLDALKHMSDAEMEAVFGEGGGAEEGARVMDEQADEFSSYETYIAATEQYGWSIIPREDWERWDVAARSRALRESIQRAQAAQPPGSAE